MDATLSDFWWLDNNQLDRFTFLEFGYHEPVDNSQSPSIQSQKCQIADIDKYRSEYQNINVHRSLKLADNPSNGQEIIGPFLVDIDNDDNLGATQNIAKQTLEYLIPQYNLSPVSDFRVFFTGHKGFNIEAKPSSLKIGNNANQYESLYRRKRRDIIDYLRKRNNITKDEFNGFDNYVDNNKTLIDVKHEFTRLHNSFNSWVGDNGKIIYRKKIELSYQDLFEASIEDILNSSEM